VFLVILDARRQLQRGKAKPDYIRRYAAFEVLTNAFYFGDNFSIYFTQLL